ncbi:hypothetical protein ACMHYB_29315 [Sorangium sp. So ce1128]
MPFDLERVSPFYAPVSVDRHNSQGFALARSNHPLKGGATYQ